MFLSKRGKLYVGVSSIPILENTFNGRRFVWNKLLGDYKKSFEEWVEGEREEKPKISSKILQIKLMELKTANPWLYDVSNVILQQSLMDLHAAFQRFFRGESAYPKFKSKKRSQSFRFSGTRDIHIHGNSILIPKCKQRSKFSKNIKLNNPSSYTVTRDNVGDYFISFVDQIEEIEQEPESKGKAVGVDLGIKSLAVIKPYRENPWELENPKTYTKYQKRRTMLSRRLSKKKKGSNNRNKARIKLAKLERKISRIRSDLLHKFTTKIVRENQTIVLEDLNVKGMLRNHNLAKSIQDASFGIIRRMLTYKVNKYKQRKVLCLISRTYPSTQICSHCGIKSEVKIKLHVREWTCGHCGTHHDRDINAATNILNEGCRLTQPS